MKFLCPLTLNATNQSTSHLEDKHIFLYIVCVYLNVLDCVCDYMSTCTFVFLCVTPYASWVVPAPGVRGVLHFQLRRELGLLCGSTPAKSVIYCPQRARRDWQCFLKNLLRPGGRQQPPQPRLTLLASPKISKPKSLDKHRPSQVRHSSANRFRMHLMLRSVFYFFLLALARLKL